MVYPKARSSRGAALVEYGLLVGLVAVVAITSVAATGGKVSEIFGYAAEEVALDAEGGTSAPPAAPRPWACGDPMEIAGEDYGTVVIGQQCWTTENLRAPLENSLCYNNDPANCEAYGRLYYNRNQNQISEICPADWRLPGTGDWDRLVGALGGNPAESGYMKTSGAVGAKLADWTPGGTNSSGFTALAAGYQSNGFHALGQNAGFLTAGSGRYALLTNSNDGIYFREGNHLSDYHMSARCMTEIE